MTGVDPIEAYLREARDRVREQENQIEFITGDIRTFVREDAFAAIVVLGTSCGIFGKREEEERSVRNLYRSLKDGGKVLIELVGKENMKRNFTGTMTTEGGGIPKDAHW